MKKALVVLLIVAMLPMAVFAGRGMLDLTVGGLVEFDKAIGEFTRKESPLDIKEELKKFENYKFGGEVRLHFTLLELDATVAVKKADIMPANPKFFDKIDFSGTLNAGVGVTLFGLVRASLTAGPEWFYKMNAVAEGKQFYIGEMTFDRQILMAKLISEGKSESAAMWLTAPLQARANVEFLLGGLTFGVGATLKTPFCVAAITNLEDFKKAYADIKGNWVDAKANVFLGINIF